MTDYKITLYNANICPFAQRVRIVLKELELEHETVEIDLSVPREEWYLKEVNPRGLVPAIKISGTKFKFRNVVLTESAIIVQFLSDLFSPSSPKHHHHPFQQPSTEDPLGRARAAFFIDTFSSKVGSQLVPISKEPDASKKDELVTQLINNIVNEIDPLLECTWKNESQDVHKDHKFFGGSDRLTIVEVMAAPVLQRLYAVAGRNKGPFETFKKETAERTKYFHGWVKRVLDATSVRATFNEDEFLAYLERRYGSSSGGGDDKPKN